MERKTKIIIIVFILILVLSLVFMGVYRMYIQFNPSDVKDYIQEETDKYPADKQAAVYKIIKDGVDYILSDSKLTKQVLSSAKSGNTPREAELVHAAVMQAKSYGYLD